MRVYLSPKSTNSKTGSIPVSTTSADSCPDACPLKGNGCYAESYPLKGRWQEVTDGRRGVSYEAFLEQVRALPDGQLWRHNQAGDLPGEGDWINQRELRALVRANDGKRGFTYTHKPVNRGAGNDLLGNNNRIAVFNSNARGFTVNLSANNLEHADELAELEIAPVVTVLPSEIHGNVKIETPAGRRVAVCPATYDERVTCASCQLCQRQNRKVIVGFPAHGNHKKSADKIAKGE